MSHIDESRIARAAAEAVDATIAKGAARYKRARHLPRLLRIDPWELDAPARHIVARLEGAIEGQREFGLGRHHQFSFSRLMSLRQALAAERARAEVEEIA